MGQQLRPVIGSLVPGRSSRFPGRRLEQIKRRCVRVKILQSAEKKSLHNLEDIADLDEITGKKIKSRTFDWDCLHKIKTQYIS